MAGPEPPRAQGSAVLVAECRAGFLAALDEFARDHGFRQPEWREGLRSEAGAAFDELAGLKDRQGFEMARSLTASRISLVHEEDLEFSLVLSDVARRVRERTEHSLSRVHLRMMRLLGQHDTSSEQCPVGPEAACRGLRGLAEAAGLDPETRMRLLKDNVEALAHALQVLYRTLDERLESAGLRVASAVRPTGATHGTAGAPAGASRGGQFAALRRSLLPAAEAASPHPAGKELPPALVALIHQWIDQHNQDADDGGVGVGVASDQLASILAPERAAAVLAVEQAFDAIASEPRLAGGLRIALARLQIPLLKLALKDDTLFTMPDHPASQLMQAMATACAGISVGTPGESPWCARIDDIARGLQRPDGDIGRALTLALGATEAVIHDRMMEMHDAAAEVADAARRAERQDECLAAASRGLCAMIGDDTPGPVRDLLELYWVQVLARTAYARGEASAEYNQLLRTAADLLDSVRPESDSAHRRELLPRLPNLIARLRAGLDLLGIDEARRNAALGPCMDLHSAIIRGSPPPASQRSAPVGLRLRPVQGVDSARVLMHGGHVTHEPVPAKWLSHLDDGDWVRITAPELGAWHGCLAGFSPQREVLILVAADAAERLLVTRRALASLADEDAAHLLQIPSPLDVAVRSVFAARGTA